MNSSLFLYLLFSSQYLLEKKVGAETADAAVQILFYVASIWLSISSIQSYSGSGPNERIGRSTELSSSCMNLYLMRTILHLPFVLGYKFNKRPTLLHHLMTGGGSLYCIWTGRIHFYCSYMVLTEVSSLPLSVLFLAKQYGLEKTKMVSGILLLVSFFLFKILLLPYIVYLYIQDATSMTADLTFYETYIFPLLASLLFFLYVFWFEKIVSGARKMLSKRRV